MTGIAAPPDTTPNAMVPIPCAVKRVIRETFDTFTLELDVSAFPGGRFPFHPGQFNMLYMFGVGEAAVAISGDPLDPTRLIHTIRSTGTVTSEMRRLTRGGVIGVRGPFGNGWPLEEVRGRDVVLIAGGIGMASIRSALFYLVEHRSEYGRLVLLYGARSKQEELFTRQIDKWKRWVDLHPGVRAGLPRIGFDEDRAAIFVCGPEVMMRSVFREMERREVPGSALWVSLERSMKCGVGICGHCQIGPHLICKQGPVFRYDGVKSLFGVREL